MSKPPSNSQNISRVTTLEEIERSLVGLELDDLISHTKLEKSNNNVNNDSENSNTSITIHDVELEDLDEKITKKLNELKMRAKFSTELDKNKNDQSKNSWVLREEQKNDEDESGRRQRWLVARSFENEVELSIDLGSLEAKADQKS